MKIVSNRGTAKFSQFVMSKTIHKKKKKKLLFTPFIIRRQPREGKLFKLSFLKRCGRRLVEEKKLLAVTMGDFLSFPTAEFAKLFIYLD